VLHADTRCAGDNDLNFTIIHCACGGLQCVESVSQATASRLLIAVSRDDTGKRTVGQNETQLGASTWVMLKLARTHSDQIDIAETRTLYRARRQSVIPPSTATRPPTHRAFRGALCVGERRKSERTMTGGIADMFHYLTVTTWGFRVGVGLNAQRHFDSSDSPHFLRTDYLTRPGHPSVDGPTSTTVCWEVTVKCRPMVIGHRHGGTSTFGLNFMDIIPRLRSFGVLP